MPAEILKPQPSAETTALAVVNKDPSALEDIGTTLESQNQIRISIHLFLLSLMNRNTTPEKIRTSPDIQKNPDLIAKPLQITSDSGKMEADDDCIIQCPICFQKCNRGLVHPTSIKHTCDGGHQF